MGFHKFDKAVMLFYCTFCNLLFPQLTVTTLTGVSGHPVRNPVDPGSCSGVEPAPIPHRLTVDLIAQGLGDLCRAHSAI